MKKKMSQVQGVTWIDFEQPNQEAYDLLRQRYSFHALDMVYSSQEFEISKVDMRQRYMFLALQFPIRYLAGAKEQLKSRQICIFLGPEFIITLHSEPFEELDSIFRTIDKELGPEASPVQKTPGFLLYRLMSHLHEVYVEWIDRTHKTIESSRAILENTKTPLNSQEISEKLALAQDNAARITRMIAMQQQVAKYLLTVDAAFMPLAIALYTSDLLSKIDNIALKAQEYADSLHHLQETCLVAAEVRRNNIHKELNFWVATAVVAIALLPLGIVLKDWGAVLGIIGAIAVVITKIQNRAKV